MATFSYDTVVYGSGEFGIIFALAAAETGAKVALISETRTFGAMTGGSLGVLDISGQAQLKALSGLFAKYLRLSALEYGLRVSRLIVPSQAEQLFIEMMGRAGVDVHYSEQLASAVVNGGTKKITSITMLSGNTFTASTYFDGSMCNDLVQMVGTEGVTWAIGTEASTQYGESKGGYQAPYYGDTNPYQGESLNVLVMPDPGLTTGAQFEGVQAYAHRVLYAPKGQSTAFTTATIKQLSNGLDISVMDPSIYDPAKFEFYGKTRAGERTMSIDKLVGGGRGFLPNSLVQDNDDIPLVAAGRPRHWDYSRLNTANPQATYTARLQLEYDAKLFIMQSRAWMATDSSYSGEWQDSSQYFGWPRREFRGNDGIPWQFYIREGARPLGDYVLAQDDLAVTNTMAARNVTKADAISLSGFNFDTHISAYTDFNGTSAGYRLVGKTASGAPDTAASGYQIPWRSCYNSNRPNLMHVPSCSHLAWSSVRLVSNMCHAAEACGVANQYLLANTLPADVNISAFQALLTARGLVRDLV